MKTSSSTHSAQAEAESTLGALESHLRKRPARSSLIEQNILKEFRADPKLHETIQALIRSRRESKLGRLLSRRRSLQDLMESDILPTSKLSGSERQQTIEAARVVRGSQLASFLANRPTIAEVARLNLVEDTMTWTRVLQAGPLPLPRNCATLTPIGTNLYLAGGYGNGSRVSELLVFDTASERWSRPLVAGMVPCERFSHTCSAVGSQLIYFGGCSEDGQWLNDIHVLDTESQQPLTPTMARCKWKQLIPQTMLMYYEPQALGDVPSPRAAHTATVIGTQLYVFAGNNGQHLFNDLYVLDTETMHWTRIDAKGEIPSVRAGHAACCIDETRLAVFGGGTIDGPSNELFIFNIESQQWKREISFGTPPAGRVGHSMETVFGSKLLVFGGGTNEKVYDDLHIYDIATASWSRPSDTGTLPAPRTGHASCLYNDRLFVFGGADIDGNIFNDLHDLDCAFLNLSSILSAEVGSKSSRSSSTRMSAAEGLDDDATVSSSQILGCMSESRKRIEGFLQSMRRKTDERYTDASLKLQTLTRAVDDSFSSLRRDIDDLSNAVLTELSDLEFLVLSSNETVSETNHDHTDDIATEKAEQTSPPHGASNGDKAAPGTLQEEAIAPNTDEII